MLLSEFSQAKKIILCPNKIVCNCYEQDNLLGDVLNSGYNVDDQEYYGFRGSFLKIAPTVIDDYLKKQISEYATKIFETPEKYGE